MNTFNLRFTHGCLPRASIELFIIWKPDTESILTDSAPAIYFFINCSSAASEGSSLRAINFCMQSGFYPEKGLNETRTKMHVFDGKFTIISGTNKTIDRESISLIIDLNKDEDEQKLITFKDIDLTCESLSQSSFYPSY